MRTQKQSFYRFRSVLHLFAFAVLMMASSLLLAAKAVKPPEGLQGSEPHFKFAVPINLTNLDPRVKQVRVECKVTYLGAGNTLTLGGEGHRDVNVDVTGKVAVTVPIQVFFTDQHAQWVSAANQWVCRLSPITETQVQRPFYIHPPTLIPTIPSSLRTGSPTVPGDNLEARGNIR